MKNITGIYLLLFSLLSITPSSLLQAQVTPSPEFLGEDLMQSPAQAWVTNGGNLYNWRYSPLDQINKNNVSSVKANWRTHLESGTAPNHSGQAQVLFYEGVLYTITGENDVFAIDVETGEHLWQYNAKLDPNRVNVCCGWVSRGVAMGEGKIYIGRLDAKIVALDQVSGEVAWEIQAEDPLKGYAITSAPLYFDGMIITGFAGGELGIRGRIKAYDAATGDLLWTFYTIPGPDEFGHDTWPANNDNWMYGGAPIWQTPTVDPELGMVYFSTGNAAPDFNGSTREGDNLFTVSMIGLDVYSGEYKWHFQQVHHDIWDYDSPNPTILFDAQYDGETRKGIAEVSKTGWVYILDRITGEPLIGIEERPVPQEPRQKTAATQPYPIGDAVVPQEIDIAPEELALINQGRIFTPFWTELVIYKPQMAVNWAPSSYDPENNHMYICGIDNTAFSNSDGNQTFQGEPEHDRIWMGAGALTGVSIARRGIFSVIDLKTNRLQWQRQWTEGCMSGSINTGGGLILAGRSDGRLTAMDKSNGEILWAFRTDAGVNAPATTFMHEGVQYIAVMSAGTVYSSGDHGDSLWLFSLNGEMESLPFAQAVNPLANMSPVEIAPGEPDLQAGQSSFDLVCAACHGNNGLGGGHSEGISLQNVSSNLERIATVMTRGQNEQMPAFENILSAEQIRDVANYVNQALFE